MAAVGTVLATFRHNHAGAALACDFFLVVTATFQRLHVFVLFNIAPHRVVQWNVAEHHGRIGYPPVLKMRPETRWLHHDYRLKRAMP